jgi:hypothetical protein
MSEGAAGVPEQGDRATRAVAAGDEPAARGAAPLASAPNADGEAASAVRPAAPKTSDESRYRFDGLLILRAR